MKTCSLCGVPQPVERFYRRRASRSPACKTCENAIRMRRSRAAGEYGPGIPAHLACGISQEECARRLGVTKRRVQQLEARALRKMRLAASEEWR